MMNFKCTDKDSTSLTSILTDFKNHFRLFYPLQPLSIYFTNWATFTNDFYKNITGRKTFEITKVLKPVEVEGLGPCDAGFPIYIERSFPMALALKVSKKLYILSKF